MSISLCGASKHHAMGMVCSGYNGALISSPAETSTDNLRNTTGYWFEGAQGLTIRVETAHLVTVCPNGNDRRVLMDRKIAQKSLG